MPARPDDSRDADRASRRFAAVSLAGAILLVLAVGIRSGLTRSLRLDEALSLETSAPGHSLGQVVHQALWFEQQPPLYFTLLHFWLGILDTPAFGRLLSTLAVVGAVAILWRLARDLELRGPWVSLPFLAACCPFVLWAASDMRSYGLTLLLTAATTWGFTRLWIVDKPAPRGLLVGYVTLTALSLLTFYYTGFLFAAQLLAAWLSGRRRKEALIAAGIITVLLLPAIPVIQRQFGMHITGIFPPPPEGSALSQAIDVIWRTVAIFFDTFLFSQSKDTPWLRPLLLLLVAALIASRIRLGRVRWPREAALLALTGFLPFLVLETFDVTNFALVSERHRGIIILPLLAAAALVVDRIPDSSVRAPMGLTLSCLMAWFGLSFVRTDRPVQDYQAAARYVTQHEGAGEPIFFFDNVGVLAFKYYYRGSNSMLGLPRDYTLTEWSNEIRALEDSAQLRSRIDSIGAGGRDVLDRGAEADGTLCAARGAGGIPEGRGRVARFAAGERVGGVPPRGERWKIEVIEGLRDWGLED